MLNVGPKPDGTIPAEAQFALEESGEWFQKYPDVIYRAESSPWGRALPWGDVTVSKGKLNLCIYEWPIEGRIYLPGLENEIISANLLVDGKKKPTEWSTIDGWKMIKLPAERPENLISVVEIELDGNPKVDWSLAIDPVYVTRLPVDFAKKLVLITCT